MEITEGERRTNKNNEKQLGSRSQTMKYHSHNHHYHYHYYFIDKVIKVALLCGLLSLPCLVVYRSFICYLPFFPISFCNPSSSSSYGDYYAQEKSSSRDQFASSNMQTSSDDDSTHGEISISEKYKLESVLRKAATKDKTVIITSVNNAWAKPNSTFDVFLESFRVGIETGRLVNHLVVIALDSKAYARCLSLHRHCYALDIHEQEEDDYSSAAYFMSPAYLKIVWRNIHLLCVVLELGYNFVFTDVDILWFKNPFPRLHKDADLQISCDSFRDNVNGSNNIANLGFEYARSNIRTIKFYKFLYTSREKHPGQRITEVFNKIKHDSFVKDLGLRMRFLDTAYFGGLCEPSKDLNLVCTMHANCCTGLENKVHDLKVMLDDWRRFRSIERDSNGSSSSSWTVPQECEQFPYM